jgi:hypothetical protein
LKGQSFSFMKYRPFFLSFLFFCLIQFQTTYALESNASWKGSLRDANGRTIAVATVELRSTATGQIKKVAVNTEGNFEFSALAAGSYKVSVQLSHRRGEAGEPLRRIASLGTGNPYDLSGQTGTQSKYCSSVAVI